MVVNSQKAYRFKLKKLSRKLIPHYRLKSKVEPSKKKILLQDILEKEMEEEIRNALYYTKKG